MEPSRARGAGIGSGCEWLNHVVKSRADEGMIGVGLSGIVAAVSGAQKVNIIRHEQAPVVIF